MAIIWLAKLYILQKHALNLPLARRGDAYPQATPEGARALEDAIPGGSGYHPENPESSKQLTRETKIVYYLSQQPF